VCCVFAGGLLYSICCGGWLLSDLVACFGGLGLVVVDLLVVFFGGVVGSVLCVEVLGCLQLVSFRGSLWVRLLGGVGCIGFVYCCGW